MKKSIQFVILTCTVSWIIAGTAILCGLRQAQGPIYLIFASSYMMLPAICSVILQIIHKEKPFRNIGISFKFNRWFIIAGIVPVIYTFVTLGINLLFPHVSFSAAYEGYLSTLSAEQAQIAMQQLAMVPPVIFFFIQLFSAIVAGYTINNLLGFGEELGWRGYFLKSLKHKKMLPASLIIGTVWGLWHFPLILIGHNYPLHPIIGVGMMIIFCILLTPMMIYIVIKSGSVITASIFHGVNNAIGGITLLYLVGGNDLINGITGLAGFIALLLMNVIFILYDTYITKERIITSVIGDY
ncbi:MAG: CPBP family intramembrane metalloprotease [Spirochaetaceae bacterium]|jgi:membrane protease YdiL (CAAX protease family)|nr:CPBP family intramembrane metalloprotease [Spirochaetaceae bacterium]